MNKKTPRITARRFFITIIAMCPGRDSNSHVLRHTPLKRTCLPVSPPGLDYKGNFITYNSTNIILRSAQIQMFREPLLFHQIVFQYHF